MTTARWQASGFPSSRGWRARFPRKPPSGASPRSHPGTASTPETSASPTAHPECGRYNNRSKQRPWCPRRRSPAHWPAPDCRVFQPRRKTHRNPCAQWKARSSRGGKSRAASGRPNTCSRHQTRSDSRGKDWAWHSMPAGAAAVQQPAKRRAHLPTVWPPGLRSTGRCISSPYSHPARGAILRGQDRIASPRRKVPSRWKSGRC